jgi:hypothetical protein
MYRNVADAQIGICYGGAWDKSTNGFFYKGEITESSLSSINPDKQPSDNVGEMDEKIVVASLTGKQIKEILNTKVDVSETKGLSPYYVAAGLKVEFNPWAENGKRVLSCCMEDGEELEDDRQYSVAYYADSLPDGLVEPERAVDMTWLEAFREWLDSKGGKLQKPRMTITLKYEGY